MRDIKFRGKPKNTDLYGSDFIYGDIRRIDGKIYICQNLPKVNAIRVTPETVGQFAEKKDMNGDDIYEGAEVRILYTDWLSQSDYSISLEEYKKSISQKGIIVFVDCSFQIEFTVGDYSDYGWIDPGTHGEIEIIGNIP